MNFNLVFEEYLDERDLRLARKAEKARRGEIAGTFGPFEYWQNPSLFGRVWQRSRMFTPADGSTPVEVHYGAGLPPLPAEAWA